jgi:hypothetical protein
VNPKAQTDLHPDVDLLSAFAEHALPEAEHARIMAHMAGCARCREVVFLAHAAAEPQIVVAPAQGTGARQGWFSAAFARWRVALIPAAALAAVGAVVLWVRLHPAPASVQMAQMVAPPSAPAGAATAKMAPQLTATAHPDLVVAPPRAAAPAAKTAWRERQARKPAASGLAGRGELAQNQPPPPPSMDRKRSFGAVHLDGRSASLAMQAPVAAPGPPEMAFAPARINPQVPQQETLTPPAPNSALAAGSAPAPAPTAPGTIAVHGASMAPATGGPQPLASTGAQMVLTPETTNGFAMMRLARRARLPSGLNAVSSAAMLNRLVALDSAGAVFLSADGGKHWETVAAQWSGKAIQVQAPPDRRYLLNTAVAAKPSESLSLSEPAPVETGQNEDVQPASPPVLKSKAGPAPPMLFKLVTDRHQTWVSTDGKLWREQ